VEFTDRIEESIELRFDFQADHHSIRKLSEEFALSETIYFNGLEITFGEQILWGKVDVTIGEEANLFGEIYFSVPVKLVNTTNEIADFPHELDVFRPDGTLVREIGVAYGFERGSISGLVGLLPDGIIDELQEAGARIVGTQGTTQIGANEWTYISRELDIGNVVLRARQFINIYDGYIRMITVNFGTESEELTKIMSMFICIGDSVPEAAAIEFNADLIDSWFWDEDLDAFFTYEFFADGTGTRGFVDLDENTFTVIPRDMEIFNWRASGNTLLIESELGADGWAFSLDEYTLTFNSLQEPGLSMILGSVDYPDFRRMFRRVP